MRFETLLRTLLLGVALGVSPAWAAELAPAERVGGGADALQSLPAKDVSNSQQRRLKKARIKGGKRAADTEAVLKKDGAAANRNSGEAAAAIPENIPPAEPQSIALRGVRG